jgi:Mg-chelatase subunit ChlD
MNPRPQIVSITLMARWSLVLLLVAGLTAGASAQREVSSAEARAAQFVFVVDDSGSMRQTDPNRLAVFAVRSILGMLDDRDEVSVVRLNAPREGSPPPPIEPLRENREQMDRLLALNGSIASYGAPLTPCSSALQAVRRLLEESYRPEAAQVVFFLTDGECDPPDFGQAEARRFLDGLPAHAARDFQFYLLRFRGKAFTQALADLARATGAGAIEVAVGDPTTVLHPFAQALSRSQGYESYLLAPGDPRLPAHRGAERVRLLAVAPGQGPKLDLELRDAQGRSPDAVGAPRAGTHRYGTGEVFRFAALDYRPGVAPVTVQVSGAGAAWKVVAVPEYRLSVHAAVREGSCSDPGEEVGFGIDTGSSVCVVAELRNAAGEVVSGSLTRGDLVAKVLVRHPEQPDAEPAEMVANPMGDEARFGLQRSNLGQGQVEFQPLVTLRLSTGDEVHLRGRPVALEVSSIQITPEPASLDLGTLRPGESALAPIRFTGAFPPEAGRLELRDRQDIPSCVTAQLSGVPEGEGQPILVDQTYTLAVRVAPYCGPAFLERRFDTVARLVFTPAGGSRRLPTVELPLRVVLDYRIEPPPEILLEVRGGGVADATVPLRGNFVGDVELRAVLAGPEEADAWPDDRDDLALGFAGAVPGELVAGEEVGPTLEQRITASAGSATAFGLRARAGGCCPGGRYRTKLGLTAPGGEGYAPGLPPPAPLLVPVTVDVAAAGFWACWGPWILAILAAILAVLLILYLVNMWRNSRFLDPRRLADKLEPLVWSSYGGGTEVRSHSRDDVRHMVEQGLPWTRRSLAWLQANPLAFGLPGGSYAESVELFLRPHHDVATSRVSPMAQRDVAEEVRRKPEEFRGRLFACAKAGTTFLGVPDLHGRINQMVRNGSGDAGSPGPAGEPPPARPLQLTRTELLQPVDEWSQPEPGSTAGWRVG